MSDQKIDNIEDEKNIADIQPGLDAVNVIVSEEPEDIKVDVHTHLCELLFYLIGR